MVHNDRWGRGMVPESIVWLWETRWRENDCVCGISLEERCGEEMLLHWSRVREIRAQPVPASQTQRMRKTNQANWPSSSKCYSSAVTSYICTSKKWWLSSHSNSGHRWIDGTSTWERASFWADLSSFIKNLTSLRPHFLYFSHHSFLSPFLFVYRRACILLSFRSL